MAVVTQAIPEHVEDRVRLAALAKRVRTTEFFKDFDKLRTGYITSSQFQRCLNSHFGVTLSEEEQRGVLRKYDKRGTGMVNYREFCATVDNAFNPDLLDGKPHTQPIPTLTKTLKYLPGRCTTWDDSSTGIKALLKRCQQFYKYQGVSIRACYEDFDRHNRGLVTESQFYRSFPGPTDVSEAELQALARHYLDPSTGLYNYLRFHADIKTLEREEEGGEGSGPPRPSSAKKAPTLSLDQLFAKIRDVVYKNGIRTTEFFKDHDKLRSGVITENQFVCGLSLCCGQLAHLNREEIQRIVEQFRTEDGRVRYKGFCDMMENSYNVPHLEQNPTLQVHRPLKGELSRQLNPLSSPAEEQRLEEVLSNLRSEVKKRRLLMYPYYRDFDMGKGYTRGVTKPQFARLLHFLSIQVSPEDLKLIERKFESPVRGDINYSAFIQAIDEEYTAQVYETEQKMEGVSLHAKDGADGSGVGGGAEEGARPGQVDVDMMVERIREHVDVNRIRVSEHFQDFDPLRSGSISCSRFRQGLTAIGQPSLSHAEFTALCGAFRDPRKKDHVLWKEFLARVDRAYGEAGLELAPTRRLLSQGVPLPRVGAVDWASGEVTEEQKRTLEAAMYRLREQVAQRRVLAKPCFQDFDRHHHGYVTTSQFRQCMSYLHLPLSNEEAQVITMHFSDDKGFYYLKFLEEIQPSDKFEDKYQQRMSLLLSQKAARSAGVGPSTEHRGEGEWGSMQGVNVEAVLDRMKAKVSKERIRVLEFLRDYDKLRSYRIPATSFRRALDLCGFNLSEAEMAALEDLYRSPKDPKYVEYKALSDEMESMFAIQGLEKMPTLHPELMAPPDSYEARTQLTPEQQQILERTMHRLAERVRVRRIQIMPLFEDYDKVHIGSVTRSQFHRVLSELELGGLVNALEFAVIYFKFAIEVGGRYDVNYISFCKMVDDFALTRWDDPSLK